MQQMSLGLIFFVEAKKMEEEGKKNYEPCRPTNNKKATKFWMRLFDGT